MKVQRGEPLQYLPFFLMEIPGLGSFVRVILLIPKTIPKFPSQMRCRAVIFTISHH